MRGPFGVPASSRKERRHVHEHAEEYFELFQGLTRAHGIYRVDKAPEAGEKRKGKATTVVRELTAETWSKHLEGKQGLGVVPIMDNGRVLWSAMDIDHYSLPVEDIVASLQKTPFLPCRTKSGGLHFYVFFDKPVAASAVRKRLDAIASQIGFGGCEVFPKQNKLNTAKGDTGNWINMPYFGGSKTDRYCHKLDGGRYSVDEFLAVAEGSRTNLKELEALDFGSDPLQNEELPEGPPCLQMLIQNGFPKGSMNNALINLGVYYKRAFPDEWTTKLDQANQKWLGPGTPAEVMQVIKSLQSKTYSYMCEQAPICEHCDRRTCLTRKHGVGGTGALPEIRNMQKQLTTPPLYFVDVEDTRIGPVEGQDILSQPAFRVHCFTAANIVLPNVKAERWTALMQQLVEDIDLVEVPDDSSAIGQLFIHLNDFVTGSVESDKREDVLIGKVYRTPKFRMFRLTDFISYLERLRFKEFTSPQVTAHLRIKGVKPKGLRINDKVVNVWVVPAETEHKPVKTTKPRKDVF